MSRHEYVEFLLEQLQRCGIDSFALTARRMFGGHGLFFEGIMFALIADDELYLKLGDDNTADFERAGLPRFSYQRSGKNIELAYALAPADALDDPDMLREWASKAIDAALAADRAKRNTGGSKR